jgi:excisionase family DNA binding protein
VTTTITPPGEPFVDALKAALAELIPQITPQRDPELQLYRPAEAAALLGVTENWVQERIKARSIPFTRVGRFPRLAARHIRAIQDAGEVDPATRGRRRSAA